jgi:hypothetical protein
LSSIVLQHNINRTAAQHQSYCCTTSIVLLYNMPYSHSLQHPKQGTASYATLLHVAA